MLSHDVSIVWMEIMTSNKGFDRGYDPQIPREPSVKDDISGYSTMLEDVIEKLNTELQKWISREKSSSISILKNQLQGRTYR